MSYKPSRVIFILLSMLLLSCGYTGKENRVENSEISDAEAPNHTDGQLAEASSSKTYSNERFKDVRVEKVGPNKFKIEGKAQIFEAQLNWVVEDGHNELLTGSEQTDAGAPSWGNFSFTVDIEKARPNSTLHLVLFETSGKDGSRLYELPVYLY